MCAFLSSTISIIVSGVSLFVCTSFCSNILKKNIKKKQKVLFTTYLITFSTQISFSENVIFRKYSFLFF